MAHDVGQRLHDAVGRDLDGGGESRQSLRRLDGDVQPVRTILRGGFANGTGEPQFVEGGRAQVVDQAADIGEAISRSTPQLESNASAAVDPEDTENARSRP